MVVYPIWSHAVQPRSGIDMVHIVSIAEPAMLDTGDYSGTFTPEYSARDGIFVIVSY